MQSWDLRDLVDPLFLFLGSLLSAFIKSHYPSASPGAQPQLILRLALGLIFRSPQLATQAKHVKTERITLLRVGFIHVFLVSLAST